MYQIDATALQNRLLNAAALNLLDVREEIEFYTYNIGGKNMPLSTFKENLRNLNYNKTDEIIVICKVGLRSETAQIILMEQGFQNVKNLAGGLTALRKLQSS